MTTCLVTGATEGIGFVTAVELAKLGFALGIHGRSETKANAACDALRKQTKLDGFVPVWGDLSSLAEVRTLAAQTAKHFPVLDVLLNNAGVFMTERTLTADGLETTMAVNHFAPFLLTALLKPSLSAAKAARVVNVSSMAHANGRLDLKDLSFEKGFDGYAAYSASKLANVLFTHALARQWSGTGITTHALHPGVIATRLLRTGFGGGGAKLETGARTSVYVATSPALAGKTGLYFSDAREASCARHANDRALEDGLWEVSVQRTGRPLL